MKSRSVCFFFFLLSGGGGLGGFDGPCGSGSPAASIGPADTARPNRAVTAMTARRKRGRSIMVAPPEVAFAILEHDPDEGRSDENHAPGSQREWNDDSKR